MVFLLQCAHTISERSGYADMRFGEAILVSLEEAQNVWADDQSKLSFPPDGAVQSDQKEHIFVGQNLNLSFVPESMNVSTFCLNLEQVFLENKCTNVSALLKPFKLV